MRSKKGKDFEFSIDPLLTPSRGSFNFPSNLSLLRASINLNTLNDSTNNSFDNVDDKYFDNNENLE